MKPTSYSKKTHHTPSELIDSDELEYYTIQPDGKRRIRNKKLFLIPLGGLIVIGLLFGLYIMGGSASLVPKKIQQSVDFPIYYPNSVPRGYVLSVQSFRLAEAGVVLFTVAYGNGKEIIFSEQQQPSSNDMDKFISSYLPLNSVLQVPLGQAKVGAYGSAPNIRTVLSLPVRNGPWIIVTAPSDVSHDDLASILRSLTK
jgi:hypothetical protein